MDLEQLRKINNLSHELQRHGFTESSVDAYKQAEQIIQIIPKQSASVPAQETVVIDALPAASPLAERQFQLQLEQLGKLFNQELDTFRSAVNEIVREVNALREELEKLKTTVPPKPKEKQVPLATQAKEPHPRQGNFQPGDVDIQKMFYFGTKK